MYNSANFQYATFHRNKVTAVEQNFLNDPRILSTTQYETYAFTMI